MAFVINRTNSVSNANKKRFMVCVLMAGLIAVVMANSSYAAIKVGSTDFGFTPITYHAGSNHYNANSLNFGDDANNDINFTLDHGGVGTPNNDFFSIKELNTTVLFSSFDDILTGYTINPLRAFNFGDPITGAPPTSYPNQNISQFGGYLTSDSSGINTFYAANKYLGLRTSAGYLGWLEVQITPVGDELSVSIIDYGFEDSGASILAGAGPEPEPEPNICDLIINYTGGNLNMDFSIGTSAPATWNIYLTLFNDVIPLLSIPLPAIDPPLNIPIAFPFPSVGGIGVLTTLTTPGGGVICSDWQTVNTGP